MQKENEEMRRERERERATMLKGGRGFLLDKKDYSLRCIQRYAPDALEIDSSSQSADWETPKVIYLPYSAP
jgi:hypothetical protein